MQTIAAGARRDSTSLFAFALLFSLALHVMAGGLWLPSWMRPVPEQPVPLTVQLQAVAEPAREVTPPAPVEHVHPHVQPVAARRPPPLPVQAVQHAPTPSPVTVEPRAEITPPPVVAAPVAPVAPAPVMVATAPSSVNAAGKPQVAPAHVDVAYLVKPQPAYPAMARRLGIEGLVLVRVQVSAAGVPEQVSVAQSSGTGALDDEALRAVRESRFEPARRGETAVAHVVEVPIRFRLKN